MHRQRETALGLRVSLRKSNSQQWFSVSGSGQKVARKAFPKCRRFVLIVRKQLGKEDEGQVDSLPDNSRDTTLGHDVCYN